MKSNLYNKFLKLLAGMIVVYIVVVFVFSLFVQNKYVENKFNNVIEYVYKNKLDKNKN